MHMPHSVSSSSIERAWFPTKRDNKRRRQRGMEDEKRVEDQDDSGAVAAAPGFDDHLIISGREGTSGRQTPNSHTQASLHTSTTRNRRARRQTPEHAGGAVLDCPPPSSTRIILHAVVVFIPCDEHGRCRRRARALTPSIPSRRPLPRPSRPCLNSTNSSRSSLGCVFLPGHSFPCPILSTTTTTTPTTSALSSSVSSATIYTTAASSSTRRLHLYRPTLFRT
jgi:hypothetical protein